MGERMGWSEWRRMADEGIIIPAYGAHPINVHVDNTVIFFGNKITIYPNVIISGQIILGPESTIEEGSKIEGEGHVGFGSTVGGKIKNSKIGKFCKVYGAVTESVIADECEVGAPGVHPQIERSHLGIGVKAKHVCGIRDADIGALTNISEFVTFANFDGTKKRKTKIGSGVMLGVQVSIIGGVEIGDECYVADGARVSHNLPPRTYFNPGKALKYPQFGAYRDNCAWYIYGSYLALERVIGSKEREYFLKRIKGKIGSEEEIKIWLKSPLDFMGGRIPLECLKQDGYRAIYDILGEYPDRVCGHEIVTKRGIDRKKKKELEENVNRTVADPYLWLNTPLATGPMYGFTPLEVLQMEGEPVIPLIIKWVQNKIGI